LDKKSGKICYMLSARSLTIDCESSASRKKKWIAVPNSRLLLYQTYFQLQVNSNILTYTQWRLQEPGPGGSNYFSFKKIFASKYFLYSS
jgi:hypothetical protein